MARDITDKLADDLKVKTRSELSTFLDEADALLKRGRTIRADRGPQSRHLLGHLLDRAESLLSPKQPRPLDGPSKVEQATGFVKANPVKSAAIAVGVALIVKRLLSNR